MLELLDPRPDATVVEAEYRRLLGYPRDHVPGERARELGAWARRWYTNHGRPWVYLREARLEIAADGVQLDDVTVSSVQLREHLLATHAERAVLVAVGAGSACEQHARELWEQNKPDEYFFLEIFGSAVVEHLVASMSGRICDLAERDGFMAVPHYSPGYAGWDVADQPKLHALIQRGSPGPWPEPLEVLSSGMLRPKKSLLAVFGLTARTEAALRSPQLLPCENCSFSPCQYRRAPYRHAAAGNRATRNIGRVPPEAIAVSFAAGPPLTRNARYSVNPRALTKWAQERVQIRTLANGDTQARFRFDGTTCSNMGRPLAFAYDVVLGPAEQGFPVLAAECRPTADDTGHVHMCAYLQDGEALLATIAAEKPLLGQPLDAVLAWHRVPQPSGCFCDAASREHKWGLALEAIHFALVQADSAATRPQPVSVSTSP